MAQNRENGFNPPSPRSSAGGMESYKNTPDTRITAISPDPSAVKPTRALQTNNRPATGNAAIRPAGNGFAGDANDSAGPDFDKDPFVSPPRGGSGSLSPKASAFRPTGVIANFQLPAESRLVAMPSDVESGAVYLDVSALQALPVGEVDRFLAVSTHEWQVECTLTNNNLTD